MCKHCHLTTPRGAHEVCHACSMRLRAEVRRGIGELEDYLDGWSEFERWLAEQSP